MSYLESFIESFFRRWGEKENWGVSKHQLDKETIAYRISFSQWGKPTYLTLITGTKSGSTELTEHITISIERFLNYQTDEWMIALVGEMNEIGLELRLIPVTPNNYFT